ncbi:endonuclease/exonuclease/phosphatase family protein [Vibrio sp. FNV 38]|nr:endonuclease/exonuclease/phosphatase family protein [Vibrio sp. FNV 38]
MSDCIARSFTLATHNLFNYMAPPNAYYQFDNIYTAQEWHKKQRWLSRHLDDLSADMIGFQEVFSAQSLEEQTRSLGYQYFACLAEPKVESDYVYSNPPLAFASRFPIIKSYSVNSGDIRNLSKQFQFSRAPLHCVVEVPEFGLLNIIVVHLKSQRSSIELSPNMDEAQSHEANVHGRFISSQQRESEADAISHYVRQLHRQQSRPCVVLGDFNQDLRSTELHCLSGEGLAQQKGRLQSSLFDSYLLQASIAEKRPATHYYGEQGNVLDYVLLSGEFSSQSKLRRGKVVSVEVLDKHLISPSFEHDQFASDHASVKVTIANLS